MKSEKKIEVVKSDVAEKEQPIQKEQKLVWREDKPPVFHVVKGHLKKIDNNYVYFEGPKGEIILPHSKIEEIK